MTSLASVILVIVSLKRARRLRRLQKSMERGKCAGAGGPCAASPGRQCKASDEPCKIRNPRNRPFFRNPKGFCRVLGKRRLPRNIVARNIVSWPLGTDNTGL